MNRIEAIQEILDKHIGAAFVFCNGLNSRETNFFLDKNAGEAPTHAESKCHSAIGNNEIKIIAIYKQ